MGALEFNFFFSEASRQGFMLWDAGIWSSAVSADQRSISWAELYAFCAMQEIWLCWRNVSGRGAWEQAGGLTMVLKRSGNSSVGSIRTPLKRFLICRSLGD